MKPVSPFVAATLLLHAALIAAIAIVSTSGRKTFAPPKPITVALLPAVPPVPPAPAVEPAEPPQAPRQTPRQRPPKRKPWSVPHPQPPARPHAESAPTNRPTETAAEPKAAAAPAPAPANPRPAPAPVPPSKTGVSIPATYAAANRKPLYPRMSRANDEQGTVLLRVLVRPDGSAGDVQIKASSGYPLLDEAAKSAVQSWRFNPATVDGKPVSEWYQVPIPFKLQDN